MIKKIKEEKRVNFLQNSVQAEYSVGNDIAIVCVERFLFSPTAITVLFNDESCRGLDKTLKVLKDLELVNFKVVKVYNSEHKAFFKGVVFKEYFNSYSVHVWQAAIEDCLQNYLDEEGEPK